MITYEEVESLLSSYDPRHYQENDARRPDCDAAMHAMTVAGPPVSTDDQHFDPFVYQFVQEQVGPVCARNSSAGSYGRVGGSDLVGGTCLTGQNGPMAQVPQHRTVLSGDASIGSDGGGARSDEVSRRLESDDPAESLRRPYTCHTCGSTFQFLSTLRRHQLTHITIRRGCRNSATTTTGGAGGEVNKKRRCAPGDDSGPGGRELHKAIRTKWNALVMDRMSVLAFAHQLNKPSSNNKSNLKLKT